MIVISNNEPSAWLCRRKDWRPGEFVPFKDKPHWANEAYELYLHPDPNVKELEDELNDLTQVASHVEPLVNQLEKCENELRKLRENLIELDNVILVDCIDQKIESRNVLILFLRHLKKAKITHTGI